MAADEALFFQGAQPAQVLVGDELGRLALDGQLLADDAHPVTDFRTRVRKNQTRLSWPPHKWLSSGSR